MNKKGMSSIYPELEKCCGKFFDEKDKSYYFPIMAVWSGSDREAANWFVNEMISALGEKTAFEACQNNQQTEFIHYIQHIQLEGFA